MAQNADPPLNYSNVMVSMARCPPFSLSEAGYEPLES